MKRLFYAMIGCFVVMLMFGCSNGTMHTEVNWQESPTLIREVILTDDGQTGYFVFRIGDNGKLGFGEYGPFIAGQSQKYMWHFWGDQENLTEPFKVAGIHKDTGEEINVFEQNITNHSLAPNNGANHHIPSMMMLPRAGLWKLEVYFSEQLFGNVVVNVEEN